MPVLSTILYGQLENYQKLILSHCIYMYANCFLLYCEPCSSVPVLTNYDTFQMGLKVTEIYMFSKTGYQYVLVYG